MKKDRLYNRIGMHYSPLCYNAKHKCKKVCVSQDCSIPNAFICQTCNNHHKQQCKIIPFSEVVKRFHSLQGLNKKDIYKYEDMVENTFNILIKSLQSEFALFRDQFEHLNASDSIKNFYQLVKRHKQSAVTGGRLASIMQETFPLRNDFKLKSQALLWSLSSEIVQLQKQVNRKLPFYYNVLENEKEHSLQVITNQDQPLKEIEIKFRKYREHIIGGLIENCIDNIEKLFQKDLYNIQLLYRATQNNFSAKTFHQLCDNKPNTLIMVRTEFGNIVGGFSSLSWKSPPQWQYQQDDFEDCFLFSMSKSLCQRKFKPVKRKFMMGMHAQYGPCFGDDLVIYDHAHVSKACWSNFPDCYQCKENPVQHTKHVLKQFVGVDDHFKKFNLLEWEVYKISFSSKEEEQPSFMKQYRKI